MFNKEEVFEYLDELRDSGATNMFGAAPYVQTTFGVSYNDAKDLVVEWMTTFSERHSDNIQDEEDI
jgi:hypothetical protein